MVSYLILEHSVGISERLFRQSAAGVPCVTEIKLILDAVKQAIVKYPVS